jgi:hypothetical protein
MKTSGTTRAFLLGSPSTFRFWHYVNVSFLTHFNFSLSVKSVSNQANHQDCF